MNALLGDNGIIERAQITKLINELGVIKEEIELYKASQYIDGLSGLDVYPIKRDGDGNRISLEQHLTSDQIEALDINLKHDMLRLSNKNPIAIPKLEYIEYGDFYVLDTDLIKSAKPYDGKLIIFLMPDGTYRVFHLDGLEIRNKEYAYTVIPLWGEVPPEYIILGDNTYKLYGNGTLKVIGKKVANSGLTTQENSDINSWQEFDIEKINFGNRMNLPAKKMHFAEGTAYIIDQNDELWAWGANTLNKLGQGHSYLITEPTKILEDRVEGKTGKIEVEDVWGGSVNTFIKIKDENTIYGAGVNEAYQLGQGNKTIYYNFIEITIPEGSGDVEEIYSSSSTTIIKCVNGTYGASSNTLGQLGRGYTGTNGEQTTRFIKLNANNTTDLWYQPKKIIVRDTRILVWANDGKLYATGSNNEGYVLPDVTETKTNILTLTQVTTKNIVDVKSEVYTQFITEDGRVYYIYRWQEKEHIYSNYTPDPSAYFAGARIISNGELYSISSVVTSTGTISKSSIKNFSGVITGTMDAKSMNIVEGKTSIDASESKIYIEGMPNVTKPKALSKYALGSEALLNDVLFVQGVNSNIRIVLRENGEIYESVSNAKSKTNAGLQDIKKALVASCSYALTNEGELWAKGGKNVGLFGVGETQVDYKKVTRADGTAFDNIKDIFVPQNGGVGVVILDEDNKLYYAGSTAYINIKSIGSLADINTVDLVTTVYAKHITTSPKLNEIQDNYTIQSVVFNRYTESYTSNMVYIITEGGKLFVSSNKAETSGLGVATSDFEEMTIDKFPGAPEGAGVVQVVTGDSLTLAVLSDGSVYGWGYNIYGVMGEPFTVGPYTTPQKLDVPCLVDKITLGQGVALFIGKMGEVYGIGRNDYGQLGTGDNIGASKFTRGEELEK